MRKSGLQKQIAFIFDDVAMPQTQTGTLCPPEPAAAQPEGIPLLQRELPAERQPTAPEVPARSAKTPAAAAVRPQPLPRKKIKPVKANAGQFGQQLKKTVFGSAKGMDARQKKMTMMVLVLAVIFAGVLTISLGGLGKTSAKPATVSDEPASAKNAAAQTQQQWQMPEPLPAELRNPMVPQAAKIDPQAAGDHNPGQLVVKGIVYSQTNPSAIIGESVVSPGQTVHGATVVAITRDAVEFEQDGRRWVQKVQR
jgi:hypothetical protein